MRAVVTLKVEKFSWVHFVTASALDWTRRPTGRVMTQVCALTSHRCRWGKAALHVSVSNVGQLLTFKQFFNSTVNSSKHVACSFLLCTPVTLRKLGTATVNYRGTWFPKYYLVPGYSIGGPRAKCGQEATSGWPYRHTQIWCMKTNWALQFQDNRAHACVSLNWWATFPITSTIKVLRYFISIKLLVQIRQVRKCLSFYL